MIMDNQIHNQIVSFIWGIADDCLCDVYVRGKHRDVILPMTVDNRLDAMLEDAKQAAELWGISARRVALLCAQGRIPGTVKAGKTWMLPLDAQKPLDPRLGKAATDKLKN